MSAGTNTAAIQLETDNSFAPNVLMFGLFRNHSEFPSLITMQSTVTVCFEAKFSPRSFLYKTEESR